MTFLNHRCGVTDQLDAAAADTRDQRFLAFSPPPTRDVLPMVDTGS